MPGQALAQAHPKNAGELARRKIYAGIPDDDVALALAICQKYGFDPLLKHLVLIASNIKDETTGQWAKRYNAYVTRDGLLHVAHISGQLDGLEVALGKDEPGEWGESAVYRKDMSRPFRYRVYLSEYAREPRGAWKTHPRAMLTKTAEVFALRRAFDVALTPVEEMGFEEPVTGIPVAEVSQEGRTRDKLTSPEVPPGQKKMQFSGAGGSEEWPQEPPPESGRIQADGGSSRPGRSAGQRTQSAGEKAGFQPEPQGGRLEIPAKQANSGNGESGAGQQVPPDWPQTPPWMAEPAGPRQAAPVNGNGRRRLF